jgi:hypothetical protein
LKLFRAFPSTFFLSAHPCGESILLGDKINSRWSAILCFISGGFNQLNI